MFNPGPHTMVLHAKQNEVRKDPRRFRVVVAGRRFGKTQLCKVLMSEASAAPRQKIWYVAPTYGMARQILWDELKDAIPRAWVRSVNETRMTIRLHNRSIIMLKGADKPDTLRGVGLHLVVIDEAQDIEQDTWYKVLRPTLSDTLGKAVIIGTPKAFNWLYDVYQLGQRGDTYVTPKGKTRKNDFKSWQFPTMTSPFIRKSEIAAAMQNMDEKSFNQEFNASFETMSGRVYHAFDRQTHVKPCPFNPRLPIWVGQDFNIDPMSSVVMQPQPDGSVWVIGEAILPNSSTEDTAQELDRRYFKHKSLVTIYPDPAGANRSHARGESDLEVLREAGFRRIKHRRKHPLVADRVNAVNRMFKAADGRIRLLVDPSCKHTIAALEQTIYKEGTRDVDKSQGLEHPADALGYCIEMEFKVHKVDVLGVSI